MVMVDLLVTILNQTFLKSLILLMKIFLLYFNFNYLIFFLISINFSPKNLLNLSKKFLVF